MATVERTRVSSKVETITPDQAAELLASMRRNRAPRKRTVQNYAAEMKASRWHMTGAAIVIDQNGCVVDGQHRLRACVLSGVPFTTLVVRGVDPVSQDFMDIGAKRTAGDALGMRDVKASGTAASALSYVERWMTVGHLNATGRVLPFTPADAVRWNDEMPGVAKLAAGGATGSKFLRRLVPLSGLIAVQFIAQAADLDVAEDFFDGVARGAGLESGDPRHAARERLIKESLTMKSIPPIARLNLLWRALVAFADGREMSRVQVPKSGFSSQKAWPDLANDVLRLSEADR